MFGRHRTIASVAAVCIVAASGAASSSASAPPVGPLPAGRASTIQTRTGELVAFALPHRSNGRVWRIANTVNAKVLVHVSEADVGNQVVLVFKASGPGTAVVSFGLTRGERSKAYESRRFTVSVRS